MQRVLLVPVLFAAACLFAGLYGILHDQISYTVAPDYYHGFKFYQFDIPNHLQNRLGAALVGWHASWWMGILIGAPLLIVGLILPDGKTYFKHVLLSFAVVAATALAVGLAALAYAYCTITPDSVPAFRLPREGIDGAAFERAGFMHHFSYLGGFLGIVTGAAYLVFAKVRLARRGSASGALAPGPSGSPGG
jgi:hypothetical protein